MTRPRAHGTPSTYKKGCRCTPCKTAASTDHTNYRMLATGKPPNPMHGQTVIASTCKKCGELWTCSLGPHHCPPKERQPAQRSAMSQWRGQGKGNSRAWRKIRTHILDRDQHTCRIRLAGCLDLATQAHHVFGRDLTGDDPAYIVASCAPCNVRAGHPGMLLELLHLRGLVRSLTEGDAPPAPAYGTDDAKTLVLQWVSSVENPCIATGFVHPGLEASSTSDLPESKPFPFPPLRA